MTSIIIDTTKEGEKKQKSIPYVNPQATDSELIAFAQGLVDLTNQTYESTTIVSKRNLDTDSKPDRSLTLKIQNTQTSTVANVPLDLSQDTFDIPLSYIQASNLSTAMSLGVPTNDTSKLFLTNLTGASLQWNQITYGTTYNSYGWRCIYEQITEPFTMSFKLNLPSNDIYNAWEKTITINFVTGGEG